MWVRSRIWNGCAWQLDFAQAKAPARHYILVCLLAGFIALAWNSVSREPYTYDEADYLYSTQRGPVANALESGAMSVAELVETGLHRGRIAAQRVAISEWLRNSNDIAFYRHWHGPLMFYYMIAVNAIGPGEGLHRAAMLVFPLLTIVVVWFGCLRILPEGVRMTGAALACTLFGWSFPVAASSEIAPHQLYVLAAITSMMLVSVAAFEGDRRCWYAGIAAAALALDTLEIAAALVIAIVAFAWTERTALRTDVKMVTRSCALFLGVVLVVWPAAILKLAFIKAYLSHAYVSHFRKLWGEITVADSWRLRLERGPVQWALIAVAVILFLALGRRLPTRRAAMPFLLLGGITLLPLIRAASDVPRYDLPYAPVLDCFAGIVLAGAMAGWKAPLRVAAVTGVMAACFITTRVFLNKPAAGPSREAQVIEAVRREGVGSQRLLVPHDYLPCLHYYFPKAKLRSYAAAAPDAAELDGSDAVIEMGLPVRVKQLHKTGAQAQPFSGQIRYTAVSQEELMVW